jgi:hypothetical protein
MLTQSETAVRNAIRECYGGQITGEEIQVAGGIKTLILRLGEQTIAVNLSKMTRLYEQGTSLAAIKTVSRFDLLDPTDLPAAGQAPRPMTPRRKRSWVTRLFGGNRRP